ncbi:MAG: hydroxymethylglutaryl-CoA lyase [Deinococcales bacterium]|nr:hydroxymethylglutaryl-CoA lyase [Deinococcales bacterium]
MAEAAITWVECPRDAWQGLPHVLPTARKRAHLAGLLAAGFDHLDMGSFVSPKAVPQLADTEAVLERLEAPAGVDLLAIVGNERGLERALAARGVTSVGYPLSVNDTFQRRNVGRSVAESWPLVARLLAGAAAGGLELVVYLSMGFGNPYGDPWCPADTAAAVARLRELGVRRIALADTVGNADAARVAEVLDAVDAPGRLGLHLHARPGAWRGQLEAALARGVRWFEGALGGVGGCPFAGDELVGNLPTEEVLPFLAAAGYAVGVDVGRLPALAAEAAALAAGVEPAPPGPAEG